MTFNAELAQQVLGVIEADPQHHNQSSWAMVTECGTSYCFAGWVCALHDQVTTDSLILDDTNWENHSFATHYYYQDASGRRREGSFETRARRLLGVTQTQAEDLFGGANTVEQLKIMVKDLANKATINLG